MGKTIQLFAIRAILVTVAVVPAWPQASTSTVRGTVLDQSQAAVLRATVTLTNTATNFARTTRTNEAGQYIFPGATPGPYKIVASSAGMQPFEGTLTLQVQQDAVIDMRLQVAQSTTQIQVKDVTPTLQVDSPSLGHVLERQRIEELPINGRGYQALLSTVPGIDSTGRIQAYGLQPGSHTLLFDGTQMNEIWEGWDVGRTPGLDAIEEFHVELNASSAKYTRPTTIVLSSKSGTNKLHGALFETNRNSGYGVARRREDNFVKPPYLNRNEYGTSVGGPVYLPKIYKGRDRTFFFFAWEASRNLTNTRQQWTVPTAAMRNGDFTGLVDGSGRAYRVYDPFTTNSTTWQRQPLSYGGVVNRIDPARISPMAKYLFNITPLPTLPNVNPLVDNNWVGPVPRITRQYTVSTRIDHRFSERDNVYGRYTHGTIHEEYQYPNQPMLDNTSSVVKRDNPNNALALTWVHTLSPSLVNEMIVTGARDRQVRGTFDPNKNFTALMGLPNPFGATNFPTIDGGGLGSYGFGGDGIFYLISNYATFQNNATKLKGKHELQFGFHYRLEDIPKSQNSLAGGYTSGTGATALYDPASTPTNPIATAFTGFNLANFYLGVMDYNAQFQRNWWFFRRHEYAPYFQDNWKVSPRLTLNLGIRYEHRTPFYDRNNTAVSFDFDKRAYVIGTDLDRFIQLGATLPSIVNAVQGFGGKIISYKEAGLPKSLMYSNWKNFGPRLGFAYQALGGARAFVLRGGYRISYYTWPVALFIGNQGFTTPVSAGFQSSVTNTALSPDGLPNYGLRSVPKYVAGVNSPDSIININDTRTQSRGFSALFLNPHQPDPMVQDWNLTLEKEVMANTVARIGYVGNHTDNIQQQVQYNSSTPSYIWYASQKTPTPTGEFANVATRPYDKTVYGTITGYNMTGFSNYQGLQLELERRHSKGVAYQVFLNTGNSLAATATVNGDNQYLPGAVPTDIDARNRFINYARDPNTRKISVKWNWVADMPFGRGKALLGNAHGLLDKLIGGWQAAGSGTWRSAYFALPTTYWPTGQKIEMYGQKYPIQDCRSGACYPGYLWWNAYLPANRINSYDANGKPNGVMGVPADFKPAVAPLIPWGSTALPANAPANTVISSFWDTNTVWLPLNNGTLQRTTFNDNMNPLRNQYFPMANQWGLDASLFKFVTIRERVTLRLNIDFFNVLNHPNDPTSISDGIQTVRNSGSAARTTQLTMRLSW